MKIIICDLSYLLHRFKWSLPDRVRQTKSFGREVLAPTGHVYGIIQSAPRLKDYCDKLIYCCDSVPFSRIKILPTYKAGRREMSGDFFKDYNPIQDMTDVCMLLKYIDTDIEILKTEDAEADDLIHTAVTKYQEEGHEIRVIANDLDLLQIRGGWEYSPTGFDVIDKVSYIYERTGIVKEHLHVFYKTLHGDTSDKVPNILPRCPKAVFNMMAQDLDNTESIKDLIDWFMISPEVSEGLRDRFQQISLEQMEINYKIVQLKKVVLNSILTNIDISDVQSIQNNLLEKYQITWTGNGN